MRNRTPFPWAAVITRRRAFYLLSPVGVEESAGAVHFCFHTPCPLSLREGEGVPPYPLVVHPSVNDTTPPLEGRGIWLPETTFLRVLPENF